MFKFVKSTTTSGSDDKSRTLTFHMSSPYDEFSITTTNDEQYTHKRAFGALKRAFKRPVLSKMSIKHLDFNMAKNRQTVIVTITVQLEPGVVAALTHRHIASLDMVSLERKSFRAIEFMLKEKAAVTASAMLNVLETSSCPND